MKVFVPRTCIGLVLALGALNIAPGQVLTDPTPPVNIILDSDMAHNADDVGDHAMLWALAAHNEVRVLALILSSTNDYSAACAQAVATYYGHGDVPIGANKESLPDAYAAGFSYYTQQVASAFGFGAKPRSQYPDAVTVYRQALAGAADHSVTIVAGGYYRPLQELLQSGGDSISALTGAQLVSLKVKLLIPVGGRFPDSYDTDHGNLEVDADAARYVIANWPGDVVWIPNDQFWNVITGPAATADPNTNPIKMAYNLYCSNGLYCDNVTPAWAQAGLILAARGGVGTTFSIGGQDGSTVVWGNNYPIPGRSIWSDSPDRNQAYLLAGLPADQIAAMINPLIQWAPPVGIQFPPVAAAQSVDVTGVPTPIVLSATDPQGAALTYTVRSQPAHGTLTGTAPNLTYTPAIAYIGSDSFTFSASNSAYTSNIATVSLTLTAQNHAPVASAQSVNTSGSLVSITLSATDADNDPLTYSVVTQPTHGVLGGTAPNLTYTPNIGYNGNDSFTFRANDGVADSNTATVTIVVTSAGGTVYSLRVNAGGSAITDPSGTQWQADAGFDGGTAYSTAAAIVSSTGDPRLYQTERYGESSLVYTFSNVPNGTYTVTLHFAEIYDGCFHAGCRVFEVYVQGNLFLHNFDPYATAGGGNIGIARTTSAVVSDGALSISLQAGATLYPTISAIEITYQSPNSSSYGSISGVVTASGGNTPLPGVKVSYSGAATITNNNGQYLLTRVSPGAYVVTASDRLYTSQSQNATVVANATTTLNFSLAMPAFSLRVNAGGPAITDTAGNQWQADANYSGGETFSTLDTVSASSGDPRLFQTERYANGPLQYHFSGLPNGMYTVRLYFAEIYTGCFYNGCRVFDVAVQGNTLWPSFDPYAAAGGGNIGVIRSTTASVTAGALDILLQAGYTQYPTISAIEIIRQ